MSVSKMVFVGAVAALTFAGCAKAKEEIGRTNEQAQSKGTWYAKCDTTNVAWQIAGINSSQKVFDFYTEGAESIRYFSDAACAHQVGVGTYKGTADIGGPAAAPGSRTLDLNLTNVFMTITDQGVVDTLNGTNPVPDCGINDWAVNVEREVSGVAGQALNCPYVQAPHGVYDIVKTDGQTLFFGADDAVLNKSTPQARPTTLATEGLTHNASGM